MNEEEKILVFLTGRESMPTTQIARLLGIDYYITRYVLKELEKKGIVKSEKKGRGTYWQKI